MFECKARGWDQKGGGAKLESLNTTHFHGLQHILQAIQSLENPMRKSLAEVFHALVETRFKFYYHPQIFPGVSIGIRKDIHLHPLQKKQKNFLLPNHLKLRGWRLEAKSSKIYTQLSTQTAILKAQQVF